MDPPAADAESVKTKNRPQQSCIKCRERKVKVGRLITILLKKEMHKLTDHAQCDRAKPCRACIARGWQDECEYVRTNEDREQISQAEEINSLRKELNRLKRRWGDIQQTSPPSTSTSTSTPMSASTGTSSGPAVVRAQADEFAWPRKAQKRPADNAFFMGAQQAGFLAGAGSYQNAGLQQTMAFDYAQGNTNTGSMLQYPPSTAPDSGGGSFPSEGTAQGHFGLSSPRRKQKLPN